MVGCWTAGSLAAELSVGCGLDGDSSPLGSGVCLGRWTRLTDMRRGKWGKFKW